MKFIGYNYSANIVISTIVTNLMLKQGIRTKELSDLCLPDFHQNFLFWNFCFLSVSQFLAGYTANRNYALATDTTEKVSGGKEERRINNSQPQLRF